MPLKPWHGLRQLVAKKPVVLPAPASPAAFVPGSPCGPGAPLGPAGPASPVAPLGPGPPSGPCAPAGPTAPSFPLSPAHAPSQTAGTSAPSSNEEYFEIFMSPPWFIGFPAN